MQIELPQIIPLERNSRTLARTHYAAELAVVPLASAWISALQAFPHRVKNERLASAIPMPEDAAAALHRLLDSEQNLMRIGPVISFYDWHVSANGKFRLDNFFGVDGSKRHIGPNKVFINTSSGVIHYDVITESGESCFEVIRRNVDPVSLMQFREPFCEIEIAGFDRPLPIQRYVVEPKQALVLPADTFNSSAGSVPRLSSPPRCLPQRRSITTRAMCS